MNLFEMFDKVNKTKSIVGFNQQKRLFENDNQIALFNNGNELNEDEINSDRRKEALDLIAQNRFENNPRDFHESLMKSKHPDMLTPYSVSELAQMKLFKVPGFNIGYALKKSLQSITMNPILKILVESYSNLQLEMVVAI